MELSRKKIDWDAVDLGQRTDRDIAKELGVSPTAVGAARVKRGISVFRFVKPARTELASRFWEKVQKQDEGCWLWSGGKTSHGYGVVWVNEEKRILMAHRVSWMLAKGEIPEGMHILHSCDNPPCVNPHHLRPGTRTDNMQDMISRNRIVCPEKRAAWQTGELNNRTSLTNEVVTEIKKRLAEGTKQSIVSREFGVHFKIINDIAKERTWKHIQIANNLTKESSR